MLTQEQRDALHRKYAQERTKRIRPDGVAQYVEPTGRFAYLEEDPYVEVPEREPFEDHVELLLVGCGFAGLQVAARMKEAGFDEFRMIDDAGDFGGVWYWNRYPGAMCDTAAMVYLPLLEETGHVPTAKYVKAPEIWEQAKRIARHYDLYPHAVFSTHATRMDWDDRAGHWVIETNRGDRMTATYIAMGTGPLNRPKLPGIPGLETFEGQSFHTARWNYEITGGSYEGDPMTKLADKKVGLIGTGATGIQATPPLGRDAGELYVFQRTPSAVDVRGNHPIDPEWFASLEPGWQTKWIRNFAQLQSTGFAEEDLVHDGWTDISKNIFNHMMASATDPTQLGVDDFVAAYKDLDDVRMEQIRARVDEVVGDPATAEGLKAWYRQFCKRPCFHDEYLPTFTRPNVHLVDTDGKGVERIDATGAWVGGTHYDLDVLVFASGFEFNTDYSRRSGFTVTGRHGRTLAEKWSAGMQSFQGMHVRGFPNMFILGFFQGSGLAANVTSNYETTGTTIAAIIKHARDVGAREVEVSELAEADWVSEVDNAPSTIVGGPDCTPGYYNNEGEVEGLREKRNLGVHPIGPIGFHDYIAEWRSSGKFEGLEFVTGGR